MGRPEWTNLFRSDKYNRESPKKSFLIMEDTSNFAINNYRKQSSRTNNAFLRTIEDMCVKKRMRREL